MKFSPKFHTRKYRIDLSWLESKLFVQYSSKRCRSVGAISEKLFSKMKLSAFIAFTLLACQLSVNAGNILYLSNIPSPSHFIWCKSILSSLHQRGHNITALSPDVEESTANFTYYHLENVYPLVYNGTTEMKFFEMGQSSYVQQFLDFTEFIKIWNVAVPARCNPQVQISADSVSQSLPVLGEKHTAVGFSALPSFLPLTRLHHVTENELPATLRDVFQEHLRDCIRWILPDATN